MSFYRKGLEPPTTPNPLAKEIRRRADKIEGHVSDGFLASEAYKAVRWIRTAFQKR